MPKGRVDPDSESLEPNWYAGRPTKSFADAPHLEMPAQGLTLFGASLLFQNRGAACQDRAWLAGFIAAPDGMRAFNNTCTRGATVLNGNCSGTR